MFPSQVVHGTLPHVFAANNLDLESKEIRSELGSRRPDPNSALVQITQYAIYTSRHLEGEFGLDESPSSGDLALRLASGLLTADETDAAFNA